MVTYFPKPLNNQVAAISDSLTRTQEGLGIGASGDTHDAIGSGQFVYVRDHSSLAEGLYKSTAAIAANGALSTSNLTADGSGGLNDLQSQITSLNSNITQLSAHNYSTLTTVLSATTAGVPYSFTTTVTGLYRISVTSVSNGEADFRINSKACLYASNNVKLQTVIPIMAGTLLSAQKTNEDSILVVELYS